MAVGTKYNYVHRGEIRESPNPHPRRNERSAGNSTSLTFLLQDGKTRAEGTTVAYPEPNLHYGYDKTHHKDGVKFLEAIAPSVSDENAGLNAFSNTKQHEGAKLWLKRWERGGETEGENKKIYSKALKAFAANNLQIIN